MRSNSFYSCFFTIGQGDDAAPDDFDILLSRFRTIEASEPLLPHLHAEILSP